MAIFLPALDCISESKIMSSTSGGRSITEPSSAYKIISIYLLGHMAQFSIGPAVLKKGVIFLFNQHKKYFISVAKTNTRNTKSTKD